MTVTVLPRTVEPTPQSQDLARLMAMLDDPGLAGFRADIEQAIVALHAKTLLEA